MFAGCAKKFVNVPVSEDFLQKKGSRIGLVWTSIINNDYPEGPEYTAKHYLLGQQGLLDIAVSRSFSDKISTALQKIKTNQLMKIFYFDVFTRAFEDQGFIVKSKTDPYCFKKYRMGSNKYCDNPLTLKTVELSTVTDSAFEMPLADRIYDFGPVISELGVDYVLAITLHRQGTGRSYYAIVPTSPPQGTTILAAYLIEGNTQKIISKHITSIVEPVIGEWDTPPDYENLMAASRRSFELAMDDVFISIFNRAP